MVGAPSLGNPGSATDHWLSKCKPLLTAEDTPSSSPLVIYASIKMCRKNSVTGYLEMPDWFEQCTTFHKISYYNRIPDATLTTDLSGFQMERPCNFFFTRYVSCQSHQFDEKVTIDRFTPTPPDIQKILFFNYRNIRIEDFPLDRAPTVAEGHQA